MKRPKRKRKGFTAREQKFIEAKLNGATDTEAALATNPSLKAPDSSGHQLKKTIEEKLPEVYLALGLTRNEFIQKHLARCLEAKETKFFAHEGVVTDQRDVVAWTVQQRAQDMVFQLAGDYKQARESGGPAIRVILIDPRNRPQNGNAKTIDVSANAS